MKPLVSSSISSVAGVESWWPSSCDNRAKTVPAVLQNAVTFIDILGLLSLRSVAHSLTERYISKIAATCDKWHHIQSCVFVAVHLHEGRSPRILVGRQAKDLSEVEHDVAMEDWTRLGRGGLWGRGPPEGVKGRPQEQFFLLPSDSSFAFVAAS